MTTKKIPTRILQEKVKISKETVERVNRLLKISSLSEMTDNELLAANANTYQCEGIYRITFKDGSSLNFDLCSGNKNYYDDVVWTSTDEKENITLDPEYEMDDIEIEINGTTYMVLLAVDNN